MPEPCKKWTLCSAEERLKNLDFLKLACYEMPHNPAMESATIASLG